jgi:hypothetical protein
MDLVLLPNTAGPNLKDIYHRALSESVGHSLCKG